MYEQGGNEGKAEGGGDAPLCKQSGDNQEKDGEGEGAADNAAQEAGCCCLALKMMGEDGQDAQ